MRKASSIFKRLISPLFLAGLLGVGGSQTAAAQGLTGRISGTVLDPSSHAIPAASVTLTNIHTGQKYTTLSAGSGEFVFGEVLPGDFDLRVEMANFRSFEQKGIALAASERLEVGPFALTLGQLNETVTGVTAPTALETQTSDASGLLLSRPFLP